MQLTLRQAHKVVDKINARLLDITVEPNPILSIWDISDASVALTTATEQYKYQLGRYMGLIAARSFIRAQVAYANAAEVDTLVARRKATLDIVAKFRQIKEAYNDRNVATPEALEQKVASLRESTKTATSFYGTTDQVTVSVLTKETVEQLDANIQNLQLTIETIEDQLTTANAGTKITLTADVHAVLVAEKILGE